MKKGCFIFLLILSFNSIVFSAENKVCYYPKKHIIPPPAVKKKDPQDGVISNENLTVNPEITAQATQVIIQRSNESCANKKIDDTESKESVDLSSKDIFDFLARIIGSLAWPLVIFIMISKFRNELSGLLKRLKKVNFAGSEFELHEFAEKYDEMNNFEITPDQEIYSNIDPRGAIISAWLSVEAKLYDVFSQHHPTIFSNPSAFKNRRFTSTKMIGELKRMGKISFEEYEILRDLQFIRNKIAHELDFNASPDEVAKYISLANKIEISLQKKPEPT